MMYFISYSREYQGYNSTYHFHDDIIHQHPIEWKINNREYVLINWKKIPEDEEHDVEKWLVAKKQKEEEACDKHTDMMLASLRALGAMHGDKPNEPPQTFTYP